MVPEYLRYRIKHPEIKYPPIKEAVNKMGDLYRKHMSTGDFTFMKNQTDYQKGHSYVREFDAFRDDHAYYDKHKEYWANSNKKLDEWGITRDPYDTQGDVTFGGTAKDHGWMRHIQQYKDVARYKFDTGKEGFETEWEQYNTKAWQQTFTDQTAGMTTREKLHWVYDNTATDQRPDTYEEAEKLYVDKLKETKMKSQASENRHVRKDVPLNVPLDTLSGRSSRRTQGQGVVEVEKDITVPHHSRMQSLSRATHDGDYSVFHLNDNDPMQADDHETATNNYTKPKPNNEKGVPQDNNKPVASDDTWHPTHWNTTNDTSTIITHDPDSNIVAFNPNDHGSGDNSGRGHVQIVNPGQSHDIIPPPQQAGGSSGARSNISVKDLRAMHTFNGSVLNQEAMIVASKQNYMHSLARRTALS